MMFMEGETSDMEVTSGYHYRDMGGHGHDITETQIEQERRET